MAAEEDELRPTYFELSAADSLVPSLKAALSYSLSVRASQTRVPAAGALSWHRTGPCAAQAGDSQAVGPRGRGVRCADAAGGAPQGDSSHHAAVS